MRILNLYAGIGGNRRLWGDDHRIVAVENNPDIASEYSRTFPRDLVALTDAHQYLLDHYDEFDFIWSSPPCPSHSILNWSVESRSGRNRYPDMALWQEIIYLKSHVKLPRTWCVENVATYYKPLIPPTMKLGRHFFWSNFEIPYRHFHSNGGMLARKKTATAEELSNYHGLRGAGTGKLRERTLRNCTEGDRGTYILSLVPQQSVLFEEGVNNA